MSITHKLIEYHDGDTRSQCEEGFTGNFEVIPVLAEHDTPGWFGWLHPDTDEGQSRFDQDGRSEVGRHDHHDRPDDVGKDMPDDGANIIEAESTCRLNRDVDRLLDRQASLLFDQSRQVHTDDILDSHPRLTALFAITQSCDKIGVRKLRDDLLLSLKSADDLDIGG